MSISIRVSVEDSERNPGPFSYISLSTPAGEVTRVKYEPGKQDAYLLNIEAVKRPVAKVTVTLVDLKQRSQSKSLDLKDQKVRFVVDSPPPPPAPVPGGPHSVPRRRSGPAIYLGSFFLTLMIAVGMVYFVISHSDQVQASGLGGRIYFLIAAVFGIAAVFALFGALKSSAELKGHPVGIAIKAGGPFAAVVIFLIFAVVLPYKYDVPAPLTDVIVEVRGPENINSLLQKVRILGSVGRRSEPLNFAPNTGRATMSGVSRVDLDRDGVRVEVESDQYEDTSSSTLYRPTSSTDAAIIRIELRRKTVESQARRPAAASTRNTLQRIQDRPGRALDPVAGAGAADGAHQTDAYYEAKFAEDRTDEVLLAQEAGEAFARRDYAWAARFLEQAKATQTSGAWQSSYPILYGAQLAQGSQEAGQTRHDMIEAVTVAVNNRQGYLSRAAPLGILLRNLGLVRIAFKDDPQRRRDIDELIEQVTALKKNAN